MSLFRTTLIPQALWDGPAPVFDIRTSSTDYAILTELEVILIATTGAAVKSFGLGTSATAGTARANGLVWLSDEGDPVPNVTIGTDWTTRPSVPVNYFRRFAPNPGSISNLNQIRFSCAIKIAPSTSLSFWILNSGSFNPTLGLLINIAITA